MHVYKALPYNHRTGAVSPDNHKTYHPMASSTQHINPKRRLSVAAVLLSSSLAATSLVCGEAFVLRLSALCELSLEELLSIRVLPENMAERTSLATHSFFARPPIHLSIQHIDRRSP